MNQTTLPTQLDVSLRYSIEQYQGILAQLHVLSASLSSSDDNFQQNIENLVAQQDQAADHDERLIGLLSEAVPLVKDHPLYLQRLDIVNEVLELNHLLLPKIDGMMALISHELAGLKNGRVVLGGYKQATHKQGRLVKSSA